MKDNVRIKSFAGGLLLQLSAEADFEDILDEVSTKFLEGKAFFGKAAVALSFQGRELDEKQEMRIVDLIQMNCNLEVICIVKKDPEKEKMFSRALQLSERQRISEMAMGEEVQVFRGNLTGGEKLDTPSSIIILGDVESGCSITSEKNIMILGSLYGQAHAWAGKKGTEGMVIAMDMTPEALTIGDYIYTPPKKSVWGKKKKELMTVAKVLEEKVQLLEFTKELLESF